MKNKKLSFLFISVLLSLTTFGTIGCQNQEERKSSRASFEPTSSAFVTSDLSSETQPSTLSSATPSSSYELSSEQPSVSSYMYESSVPAPSSNPSSSISSEPSSVPAPSSSTPAPSSVQPSSSTPAPSSSAPQPSSTPISSNPISSSAPASSSNSSSAPAEFSCAAEGVEYLLNEEFEWEEDNEGYYVVYEVDSGTPKANCLSIYNTLINGGFTSAVYPEFYDPDDEDEGYYAEVYYKDEDDYVCIYTWDEKYGRTTYHVVELAVATLGNDIEDPETEQWTLITDANQLKDGDTIIIGEPNVGCVLAVSMFGESTNFFLAGVASFDDDSVSKLPSLAIPFTLKKNGQYWTLMSEKGLLGAVSEQKMQWDGGTTDWTISISNEKAAITAKDSDLTLMYFFDSGSKFSVVSDGQSINAVLPQIYRQGEPEPVYPTAIAIEGKDTVVIGRSAALTATFTPSYANVIDVTWSSSVPAVAEVDAKTGVVKGLTIGQTVISATTKDINGHDLIAQHTISVVEGSNSAWTIMIYMCGSDLESQGGYATQDITEILSVANQPDDVNIIIETGGAIKWKKYNISNKALSRYHVENQKLVLDATLSDASMGEQKTFESFLTWGIEEYSADKVGVIMWNHGGALLGCCSDEKHDDDSLLNSETRGALNAVLNNKQLEFIGYDCCLMQLQDVAEFNAPYFKYMLASEESEVGEGWAYDGLIRDVYAKKETNEILQTVCDEFISETDGDEPEYNDQTLSYLDLSKMASYHTAFEDLALSLSSTVKTSSFNQFVKENVYGYGDGWIDHQTYLSYLSNGTYTADMFDPQTETEDGVTYHYLYGYYDYGSFDATDFLTQVKTLNLGDAINAKIDNTLTALDELIVYSKVGQIASSSHGLALIFPVEEYVIDYEYLASETNFVNWRNIVTAKDRNF